MTICGLCDFVTKRPISTWITVRSDFSSSLSQETRTIVKFQHNSRDECSSSDNWHRSLFQRVQCQYWEDHFIDPPSSYEGKSFVPFSWQWGECCCKWLPMRWLMFTDQNAWAGSKFRAVNTILFPVSTYRLVNGQVYLLPNVTILKISRSFWTATRTS